MNKTRRKEISKIISRISTLKIELEENLIPDLESLRDEEQEYLDNMPEGIQAGEKGEKAEEAISEMDSAIETLSTFNEDIDNIFESLENAKGE
jgi:hypothetical protein